MNGELTWGWAIGCTLALLVQVTLLVLAAPFFAGLTEWVAARFEGRSVVAVSARWREIRHHGGRPCLRTPVGQAAGMACRAALVLGVLSCALVPVFSVSAPGFVAPGLFLVCCVLVAGMLLLDLPQTLQGGVAAWWGCAQLLADGLVLPVLAPVALLAGTTRSLPVFLAGVHGASPMLDGAPYVLAGFAVFMVVVLAPWGAEAELRMAGLSGPDRAIWMLASDCLSLCWVTLAGDLAWAGSLASPALGDGQDWLSGCALGVVLWIGKVLAAAVLLGLSRLVVLTARRRARVRLGVIFLFGLLAWQMTWAAAPQPVVLDEGSAAPAVEQPQSRQDQGAVNGELS
ncbi:hypothetical protein OQ496_02405 [Acetobacter suratthaniensis]|uniref:Uncharacterized protein n=1 Tax=Acetobacter suratthaniensis TaxID=1502841 RepID=A0ABS3LHK0_9PROT|nr:hypothetical protein [Acetobacter suratthaniensis]MBO1327083.1 hypothetical protein [Acetobacter suratthaniensis]MCX2565306.1 hypothetical protein [Acetobacter suratthaniensis]